MTTSPSNPYQPEAFVAQVMYETAQKDRRASRAEELESISDEDLRALVEKASAILEGRASERRRHALAEIRRIARENGLTVSIKAPARKRGCPRKVGKGADARSTG